MYTCLMCPSRFVPSTPSLFLVLYNTCLYWQREDDSGQQEKNEKKTRAQQQVDNFAFASVLRLHREPESFAAIYETRVSKTERTHRRRAVVVLIRIASGTLS